MALKHVFVAILIQISIKEAVTAAATISAGNYPKVEFYTDAAGNNALTDNTATYMLDAGIFIKCGVGSPPVTGLGATHKSRFLLPNGDKYKARPSDAEVAHGATLKIDKKDLTQKALGSWKCFFYVTAQEASQFSETAKEGTKLVLKFKKPKVKSLPASKVDIGDDLKFECLLSGTSTDFSLAYYNEILKDEKPTKAKFYYAEAETSDGVPVPEKDLVDNVAFDPKTKKAIYHYPAKDMRKGKITVKCELILPNVVADKKIVSEQTDGVAVDVKNAPIIEALAGAIRQDEDVPLLCRAPRKGIEVQQKKKPTATGVAEHTADVFGFLEGTLAAGATWGASASDTRVTWMESVDNGNNWKEIPAERLKYSRSEGSSTLQHSSLINFYASNIVAGTPAVGEVGKFINPQATNEVMLKDAKAIKNRQYRCTMYVRTSIAAAKKPQFERVARTIIFGTAPTLFDTSTTTGGQIPTKLSAQFNKGYKTNKVMNGFKDQAISNMVGLPGIASFVDGIRSDNARRFDALRGKMIELGADTQRPDLTRDEVCTNLLNSESIKKEISMRKKGQQLLCECLDVANTEAKRALLAHCVSPDLTVSQNGLAVVELEAAMFQYGLNELQNLITLANLNKEYELADYLYHEMLKPSELEKTCLDMTATKMRQALDAVTPDQYPALERQLGNYAKEQCDYMKQQRRLEEQAEKDRREAYLSQFST